MWHCGKCGTPALGCAMAKNAQPRAAEATCFTRIRQPISLSATKTIYRVYRTVRTGLFTGKYYAVNQTGKRDDNIGITGVIRIDTLGKPG